MSANQRGTPPKDANGVIYAGDDGQGVLDGWVLYRRAAGGPPWVSLKLVRLTDGPHAANYWLAWHTEEQRIGGYGSERLPDEVRVAVEGVMRDLYPDMTDADMAAELEAARLMG